MHTCASTAAPAKSAQEVHAAFAVYSVRRGMIASDHVVLGSESVYVLR